MKVYCPICREELISTGIYPPKFLSPSKCENGHEFMVIVALAETWIQVTTHRGSTPLPSTAPSTIKEES